MTGNTADFDAFYQASARRVVLYLYAVCGDLADAQDLTQEAYARAWQHWPKVSGYDNPEGWVRAVGWRLAANRWRGVKRWWGALARLGPPEPTLDGASPDRVAVVTALRQLPAAQRQAVALHYLLDMSVQDIATSTGTPAGTVKARLSRARTALAGLLGEPDQEVSDAASHA
jgi:RNA polymerase sigma-70 factor (ECF subfamily)